MSATFAELAAARRAAQAAAIERRRKVQIKAIQANRRQLGLDEDTYRDMLEAQTRTSNTPGKRSAADLTVSEGAKVLDWMQRSGAINPKQPNRTGGKRRPVPSAGREALMAKIHALLTELGRVTGEPHGLGYADAICKRNGWASAVDFCRDTDLHLVVGALSRTCRSKGGNA